MEIKNVMEEVPISELERDLTIPQRIKAFFSFIRNEIKGFKSNVKGQVDNNINVVYSDDIMRNFVWMLNTLCWAIAFTTMGFGSFIAGLLFRVELMPFVYVLLVVLAYWLANKFMGEWIDSRAWRRNSIEGLLLIGILVALMRTSFSQLFNLGAILCTFWGYNSWKKYFWYRKHYIMAKELEEKNKNEA